MEMNRKIKIFLAAYINFPNAQNINCKYIARYLDKDMFEVHTMYTDRLPIDKRKYQEQGIVLHRLHHRYIWFWSKLFAMWRVNADIYYMPKIEIQDKIFVRLFKKSKKVFLSSIEGVVTESTNNTEEIKEYFLTNMDSFFAISECISESVKRYWRKDVFVIPLGVESLSEDLHRRERVSSVIWVGNIKGNKRPEFLIECAQRFPQLTFTMIGDGDMENDIRTLIKEKHLSNVKLIGRIPNTAVYDYLKKSDLLLMTSEYEGLPKVIQEAAQCGVPSIYISENYSVDFIENGSNGYAVKNLEQMIGQIQYLLDNPIKYRVMSEVAYTTIQAYTWENLIKDYEAYFMLQYKKKQER